MIGIIDYGMGNLRSVENALKKLKQPCLISGKKEELQKCDKIILPGVGAFGDCMQNIHERNLYQYIVNEVAKGKPLLGICLGMQMLFESSEEKGYTEGFGFLKGKIVRISDPNVPVPEIGWNQLEWNHEFPLRKELSDKPFVYFVHSYYASEMDDEDLIAFVRYGTEIVPGIVRKDHVMGCQFHPEKSGEDGLKILRYFTEEFV